MQTLCRRGRTTIAQAAGKPALPIEAQLKLELLDQDRFTNGTIHLHYRLN